MNEIRKGGQTFVGYEYKEIITNSNRISFLIDSYKNFGWEIDPNMSQEKSSNLPHSKGNVILRLKRDRKIVNKMELTRLQRNFEFCLKEIDHLEKSKALRATMYSILVGILGTIFMIWAVFVAMTNPPIGVLGVFLAVIALSGMILPNFIYKKVERKRADIVNPLIEEKQDEIFEICEKGSKLLYL